jgi:O-antigen/teichoic acid export membrane protein
LQIAATFVLTPIILQTLGDKHYGLWILIGSITGYYGLLDLGLSNAIARYVSQAIGRNNRVDQKELIDTGFVTFSVLGFGILLLMGVALLAAPWIVDDAAEIRLFRILVCLSGTTLALTLPFRVFMGLLKAHLRHDLSSAIGILILAARSAAIYYYLTHGYDIVALGVINALATAVEFGLNYTLTIPYGLFQWTRIRPTAGKLRTLFAYSVYSFIIMISDMLKSKTDSLVIAINRGLAAVTPYSLALSLIEYGQQFMSNMVGNIMPIFSQDEGRNDYDALRSKLLLVTKIGAILSALVFGGTALFSEAFITRWIGVAYPEIPAIALWLCASALVASAQRAGVSLMFGISRHKYYAVINVLEGVANLILSLILVRPYGLVGVAMGTAIPSLFFKLVVQPPYVCRLVDLPLGRYMHAMGTRGLLPLLVFAGAFWLAARGWIVPSYDRIFVLGLAYSTGILLAGWLVVFDAADRRYMLTFVGKRRG